MPYCWDHPASSSCDDRATKTYSLGKVPCTSGPLRKRTWTPRHRSLGKSV